MLAILVIDMVNEFVTGRLGSFRARKTVPKIKRLLAAARNEGVKIFYIQDAHTKDDPEMRVWGEHSMKGSAAAKTVPELTPSPNEPILEKDNYSAFYNTGLDEQLKAAGIKTLILTGVITDICILHTAADAFFRGYDIIIAEDGTDSVSETRHRNALRYIKNMYGGKVLPVAKIIKTVLE